ncbi:MAG: endonuclease/exonuclease/phosphatase family protein [Planctomycetota bacterium]
MSSRIPAGVIAATWLLFGCASSPVSDGPAADAVVRFAQFNIALYSRDRDPGEVARRLATPDDPQIQKLAAILQDVRPDVLLLNEIDQDPTGRVAELLQGNYLGVSQGEGLEPIVYGYAYSPPVNTGVPSGVDLDNDGHTDGPGDAYGWGHYPGQYGMLLLSRLEGAAHQPLLDWRKRRWIDRPDDIVPVDWYSPQAVEVMRLSSKTHALVVGRLNKQTFGVHISHPTPPGFDGPEDRNGRRNYDEIGLIVSNLEGFDRLPTVVMGDLNADPNDGSSRPGAIAQLLDHPRIQDPEPRSKGGKETAARDGGVNQSHGTDPALDTADWRDTPPSSGNLRVDYVLPTVEWKLVKAGVFWPTTDDPRRDWIDASDHRLVWVDLRLPDASE